MINAIDGLVERIPGTNEVVMMTPSGMGIGFEVRLPITMCNSIDRIHLPDNWQQLEEE